jgi:hypothetical protein
VTFGVGPGGQHEGGPAVRDARGVPGRDLPVGSAQRGQCRQLLQRCVASGVLVGADRHGLPASCRHVHGDDLLGETPVIGGRRRSDVRVIRPVVGFLPGDPALSGGVLTDGDEHVRVGCFGRVRMAGRHKPLDATEGVGRLLEHERSARHGLDAAGDDHVSHARADVGGGILDRHHAGGALALNGTSRSVGREAKRVGNVAGGAAATLEHLAEHQVLDVTRIDARSGDGSRHRLHADIVDCHGRHAAPGAPDGRADGGDDDGVGCCGHGGLLLKRGRIRGWCTRRRSVGT